MANKKEEKEIKKKGLELLREPFDSHHISKLPKPTKAQTDELRADYRKGIRCEICGGWHHPKVIHLDYVGHAALTNRLLDVDPNWNWEPFAVDENGLPCFDNQKGLWIKLTILGVTRLGYGAADGKEGGDAIKEIIGDALRNAAMRFGAALDLWHKGDLILSDDKPEKKTKELPNLDLEKMKTPGYRKRIAAYESPAAALERIRTIFTVDEVGEAIITDIWNSETEKQAKDQGDQ